MEKPIKIRNKAGDEGQCMPESLSVWEEHGWTAVEDGSSENVKKVPLPEPPSTSRHQGPSGPEQSKE